MKYITKGDAPASLENYKQEDNASFDAMYKRQDVKIELRNSLIAEQGGLCCYCGGRIKADITSKIEHLLPRSKYKDLQLEYSNLLCSCDGGEGERKGKTKSEKKNYPLHSDAKKQDKIIEITPLDKNCEQQFAYDEEGNIYGLSIEAWNTIKILGLDCKTLNNRRRSAIRPYLDQNETNWDAVIQRLSEKHDGKYLPYCFAVTYYIKNNLLNH